MTELALTEHLFRFRQADALVGGFWDDERVPPALAESMAAYWKFHATADLDAYVECALAAKEAGLPGGDRAGGRLLRGPHGRRGRACWPAIPSTSCSARCTGSGGWRFDDLDDPVSMARVVGPAGRRLLGRVHPAHGGAGGVGRL